MGDTGDTDETRGAAAPEPARETAVDARRSFGPVPAPERGITWCHDCDGRGARWAPKGARLEALPADAAQLPVCSTCRGSGRLPGLTPPV